LLYAAVSSSVGKSGAHAATQAIVLTDFLLEICRRINRAKGQADEIKLQVGGGGGSSSSSLIKSPGWGQHRKTTTSSVIGKGQTQHQTGGRSPTRTLHDDRRAFRVVNDVDCAWYDKIVHTRCEGRFRCECSEGNMQLPCDDDAAIRSRIYCIRKR
ncbi:unnamed protein product, partial [Amoebophrya sp. A25]